MVPPFVNLSLVAAILNWSTHEMTITLVIAIETLIIQSIDSSSKSLTIRVGNQVEVRVVTNTSSEAESRNSK